MKNKIINLKKVILAGAFFLALNAFGQTSGAPEKMSYQAVVRNTNNNLVTNQAVGMRVSILQGSITGTAVFTETQTPTANANGLVSFEIGGGNPVTGTFATIDWANGPYFVKTETDPTGGSNYTIVGVSQLLSTPYALYAKTSGSSTPGPQGPQGIAGPQGPAGMNGLDGATGPMGPQGPQGPTGEQGIAGPQGPAGMNGLDGATGPMGPMGPQGPIGLTGPIGSQGQAGVAGIGYGGTSSSAKTISLGSKTFVVQAGLAYIPGQRIRFVDQTNAVNFLEGTITSYANTTMVVNIDNNGGTGTISNWNLSVGGNLGTNGTNGVGVPTGGSAGQVLAKVDATNFNTQWVTPSAAGSGASVQLFANKVGGSSETLPVATSTTPTTIVFNNVINSPSLGSYNNTTGVFTVGTTGAGVYLVQVKLLCNDASPASSTVPPYLTLIKNNATYGSNGADIFYGDYPTLHNVLPTGIRGQGSLSKIVQLSAGDTFRIVAVSGNSSTAAQPTSTVAGSNITVVKM